MAPLFGLEPEQVRVISPYVGGGFGSKLEIHAQAVLAAMAARELPGRAVKVALTRQQMFSLSGYRPPTIQRVRLGADLDGTLTALAVDVVEQSSRTKEFTEGSDGPARMMYAAPQRRTTNRPVVLDVPVPTWMRAPGRCPGCSGLKWPWTSSPLACAVDPIALRVRNEPQVDPETGQPHAFRHLLDCLQLGARTIRLGSSRPGATGSADSTAGGAARASPVRRTRTGANPTTPPAFASRPMAPTPSRLRRLRSEPEAGPR